MDDYKDLILIIINLRFYIKKVDIISLNRYDTYIICADPHLFPEKNQFERFKLEINALNNPALVKKGKI
jgi:hypothetical protein